MDRERAGENPFIVNKLKLGERADRPDAMKLPLDLATVLLKDGAGDLDLDLPASGRLRGIRAEKLADVEFDYGAKTLAAPEQRLKALGEATGKRPTDTPACARPQAAEGGVRPQAPRTIYPQPEPRGLP